MGVQSPIHEVTISIPKYEYICPKCKTEVGPYYREADTHICPKCWGDYIRENFPVMVRVDKQEENNA